MHGWRVMSLPFWTTDAFYDSYDLSEPWNAPDNLKLGRERTGPQCYFHCPADPSAEKDVSYLAVVGSVTAWPGTVPSRDEDFSKGTSHSVLLAEREDSGG